MEKITNKTVEQENPHFVLELIAEIAAEQAVYEKYKSDLNAYSTLDVPARDKVDTAVRTERERLTQYLVERANTTYQHNAQFRKNVRSKANGGNSALSYLYVFMYHWVGFEGNSPNNGKPVLQAGRWVGYDVVVDNFYKGKALYNEK